MIRGRVKIFPKNRKAKNLNKNEIVNLQNEMVEKEDLNNLSSSNKRIKVTLRRHLVLKNEQSIQIKDIVKKEFKDKSNVNKISKHRSTIRPVFKKKSAKINTKDQNTIDITNGIYVDTTFNTSPAKDESTLPKVKIVCQPSSPIPKMEIQKCTANFKSPDKECQSTKKDTFICIFKEDSSKFNIPQSFSILKTISDFYDQFLNKLEFLNDQMMHIYSRAICYRKSKSFKKTEFIGKINKKMFEKALEEVDGWLSNIEIVHEQPLANLVCNLYSIRDLYSE